MNWVNLVLVSVVVIESLTDLANAANPYKTRAASCAESFCSEVQQRFGNISSVVEKVANKLLDKRCETCDLIHSATFEVLKHGLFIRKTSETQEKKFDDIENAILGLRSKVSGAEQKMAQLENKFEERFRTVSQNYDDMSKMLKTILETVTAQTNGILNAIHIQTQNTECHDSSFRKGIEEQEAKHKEDSMATFASTSEISTNDSNLMGSLEQLENSMLANDEEVEGKLENIADQTQNASDQYQNRSRAQNVVDGAELTMNTLTDGIPQNASEILQNLSSEVELIDGIVRNEMIRFVSTERYSNVRMVTNLTDYFPQQIFPKNTGMDSATFKCKVLCEKNETCRAFNIIEKQDSFVCEMLPDNLCVKQTRNALLNWPGSTLWEKTNTTTQKSCLEEQFPAGKPIPCEVLRPGCFGNWPRCGNCYKTCEKVRRYGAYTLWPDGDGPFTTPIFGYCSGRSAILLERDVNMTTGEIIKNFAMSFHDMHRLNRLQFYSKIWFSFYTTNGGFSYIYYNNPIIGTDGTLSNVTYGSSHLIADFFKLNGTALKPTPFVNISDDRYGCGSFWLLDPSNATYCPGGQVSLLGEVKMKDGKVVSTGMSYPESVRRNEPIKSIRLYLSLL